MWLNDISLLVFDFNISRCLTSARVKELLQGVSINESLQQERREVSEHTEVEDSPQEVPRVQLV